MFLLIQIKAIVLGAMTLVFVLLPTCLVALPFGTERRLKIVGPVWSWMGSFLLRYACHAKIDIQEDYRSDAYKGIPSYGLYVSNHQSYIDIPMILTMFIAPPIMKKEVMYIPLVGWLGYISGALPVSRSKVDSRKKVFEQAKSRVLKERIGLQVYPEGTRSKTSEPGDYESIKRTLLVFAFNEKIPVIPTSIYGSRGVLNPHGMVVPGRHVGIIVHKEILPTDYKNSDEFCRAIWDKVKEGYASMKSRLGPLNENLS